jgi:hypothetical protein
LDQFIDFTQRIAGLTKYVINNRSGKTTLSALAAACAAEKESVRTALHYWAAKDAFQITFEEDQVVLTPPDMELLDPNTELIYAEILQNLIKETKAFRHFYRKAGIGNLINP